MYVDIGIDNAKEGYRDPDSDNPELVRFRPIEGQYTVHAEIPEGTGLRDAFIEVTTALENHQQDPEPDQARRVRWVQSDSEGLLSLLTSEWGLTAQGNKRPKGWGLSAVQQAQSTTMALLVAALSFLARFEMFSFFSTLTIALMTSFELRTQAGIDFQIAQMFGTPGTAANWLGITADANPPSVGQTTLPGEITSGTLTRAQGTYAHTLGLNFCSLTKTYTSDQAVTIAKYGIFSTATGGPMTFSSLLNAVAVLVSGDQIQVTATVTL